MSMMIPLEKIVQISNSRTEYDPAALTELMISMKQMDLISPVGVWPLSDGKFELVFGNRRYLAAKKLGWTSIRAEVVSQSDRTQQLLINLAENIHRTNPPMADLGRYFLQLRDLGLSNSEIAIRVGKSKKFVGDAISLLSNAPSKWRERVVTFAAGSQVKAGKIPAGTYRKLASIIRDHKLNKNQQEMLFHLAAQDIGLDDRLDEIGALLGNGSSLEEAIEWAQNVSIKYTRIPISKAGVKEIERIYGCSVSKAINKILREHPVFGPAMSFKVKKSKKSA